jgi:hypothetical protein
MNKNELEIKIAYTQELINIESDQNKKNELINQLQVLQMRKSIADTQNKINQLRGN